MLAADAMLSHVSSSLHECYRQPLLFASSAICSSFRPTRRAHRTPAVTYPGHKHRVNRCCSNRERYGTSYPSRLSQFATLNVSPVGTSALMNDDECAVTLQPDNFSRYSKYLVRNSNGVDGMGGNPNTRKNEQETREDLVWVDTLGCDCHEYFNEMGYHRPFSILSWNVLAQALYEGHYGSRKQQPSLSESPHPHQWPKRLERMIQILSHSNSDIICLQECELQSFQDDLAPALSKLGYDGIAQEDERDERPTSLKYVTKHRDPRNHIAATFWKRSKFDPVGKSYVRTRSLTTVLRLKADSKNVDNKSRGKKVMPSVAIVNCHLEGHPRRFSERTHQLQHALGDLAKRVKKENEESQSKSRDASHIGKLNALLLAGDFNCELQSSACSTYLSIGRLGRQAGLGGIHGEDSLVIPPSLLDSNEATGILHPIMEWGRALPEDKVADVSPHPFRRNGLTSAFPAWLGKDDPTEHFTYIGEMNKRPVPGLDQIWFSSMTLERVALKKMFVDILGEWGDDSATIERKRDEERMSVLTTGLPDPACKYPSDHLPIGCIFDWKVDEESCLLDHDGNNEEQSDCSDGEVRGLNIVDAEGNTLDSEPSQSDEENPSSFDNPKDELKYLLLRCPYDSEQQQLDVQYILSPVEPPLCLTTKAKPTKEQLQQIEERRVRKSDVLSTASLGVRPYLKQIWKANKQVGAWERNEERLKLEEEEKEEE